MTESRHLATAELLALLGAGAVAPLRAQRHLDACALCRAELAHFRAFRAQGSHAAEAPGEAALLRAFALVRRPVPRRTERLRYAAPRLVYDSRKDEPAVVGLRGPGLGGHLAWLGNEVDVEVRWGEDGAADGPMLTGQVLPRRAPPPGQVGDVWLEQAGGPAAWCLLGPSGEFTLPVPRGRRWRILLVWGDLRLRLSP